MMGQRYLPTQIQLLNFEHDHTMHQKKLEEIQQIEAKKKAQEKELTSKKGLNEVRERNLKFHNSEKALAIEKDNQLLLGKLVEISRKKKPNLFPLKNDTNHLKTLNGPSRRREKDRIAQENEAFARRLLSQQPSFNRRKLETDYERHNDRVKNMQRLAGLSPRVRKVKLPPLSKDNNDTKSKTLDDKREGRAGNEKKNTNQITKVPEEHEGDLTEEEDTKAELAAKKQAELEKQEQEKRDQEEKTKKDNEAAAQAKAEADTQAKAEADAKAKAEADADADAKAKADADAKAKADTDAKATTEPENTAAAKQEDTQEQNTQSATVEQNQASPALTQQEETKVEQKSAEQKPVEQNSAEQKPAEVNSAEQKPAEQKPAEQQSAEQKPSVEQGKDVAAPDSQRASVVAEQKANQEEKPQTD